VSLTDRDRKLLLALVPIIVLAAYWFLVLTPKREEATTAAAALEEQQERVKSARAALQTASTAEQSFEVSYSQLVRLGKAIPTKVDMPGLLLQLDAAAAGTDINFTRVTMGERVPASEAAPAPAAPAEGGSGEPAAAAGGAPAQTAPGGAAEAANEAQQTSDAQSAAAEQTDVDTQTSTSTGGGLPVGGGSTAAPAADPAATAPPGLETVTLDLEFVGNFFNLADFFHQVKRFVRVANEDVHVSGRLVTIEGVRWSSDSETFPRLKAELTATVYLSPLAEGVTAGATPAGPPTTPVDATTPAGGTADPAATPTATATSPN